MLLLLLLLTMTQATYPVLYEISTRPWLYELSQKYGRSITKLRDIPLGEFDTLKAKGITMVWMMGVWQLGEYGLAIDKSKDYSHVLPDFTEDDIIGSPYAITQYVCNKEIGSDSDLLWLKSELNKRGLKLMLDFVPNHSACDAPEVNAHPEYFVRGAQAASYDSKYYLENGVAHGKDPYFDPWPDTAQWNYFEAKTRAVQQSNLVKVAQYADAIRCDMAHLDLNDVFAGTWAKELAAWGYQKPSTEFWADAIAAARKVNNEVIFLAEVYEDWQKEKLISCGFNYYYDKGLIDKLKEGASATNNYVHGKSLEYFDASAHMVENHDEERAVANMGSVARANAAAAIALTLPGMVFLNHGQFDGLKNKLDVHLRRSYGEVASTTAQNFYNKLLTIIQDDAFLTANHYYVWNISGDRAADFYAEIRSAKNYYLVVVNYSSSYSCVNVPIYNVKGSGTVKIKELMMNTEYSRDVETMKTTGLVVCLEGYQVQIFQYNL